MQDKFFMDRRRQTKHSGSNNTIAENRKWLTLSSYAASTMFSTLPGSGSVLVYMYMAHQTGNKACITGDPQNTLKWPYYVHQFNSVTNEVNLFQWDILSANTEIKRMRFSNIQMHKHTQWTSQIILLSHLLLFNFTDDILLTTSFNTINVSKLKFGSIVASVFIQDSQYI